MFLVYGIPTCDTVRKARKWLDARGVDHHFVNHRDTPPSQQRIQGWIEALGAKALRNTSGRSYRALPDDKKTWSDEQWARAMAGDPMLIKRPVIEANDAAVLVGFRGTDDVLAAALGLD